MLNIAAALMIAMTTASFEAKVTSVIDADTVDVLDESKKILRVRIHGIDAPERGQPFAKKARDALSKLVTGKAVIVEQVSEDRYGRLIARLNIDGQDVGETMLSNGWAWHYVKYDDSEPYATAEQQARKAGAGLWRDEHAVPPWQWRKMPKSERLSTQKAITSETE